MNELLVSLIFLLLPLSVLLFEVRVRVRDLIFVNMALIARQLHY